MSSDDIKKALNDATGLNGSDKDWKRRSKNRADDGGWERVFEHLPTGTFVKTHESDSKPLSAEILKDGFAKAAKPAAEKPFVDKKRQKAAKYCFAIGVDDDCIDVVTETTVIITPITYFDKTGYCYDQPSHLESLLPGDADDINECGTYVMQREGKTDMEIGLELIARGFVWRADFQDLIHKALDQESRAALTAAMRQRGAGNAHAAQQPKP